MGSPIQTLIDDYRDLNKFLMDNGQVSESLTVAEHYRKILLLSCASYYETRIVEIINKFVEAKAADNRISAFVSNKAISRQYHTYFNWDQTSNINSFLGLFGADFKDQISAEIKADKALQEQIKAFLTIGSERNKMVHNNFLEFTLDKTFDEIVALHEKGNLFIKYLEKTFV